MDKRILIYLNGVKIISQKGFYNTKVQDIVGAANVSVGSFYNYFNDKNDLLYFIFESNLLSLLKKLNEIDIMSTNPIEKVDLYFNFLINECIENPELQKVISEDCWYLYRSLSDERKEKYFTLSQEVDVKFINIIKHGQSLGLIKSTPPILIYNLMNSIISDSFNTYSLNSISVPLQESKDFFMNTIIYEK